MYNPYQPSYQPTQTGQQPWYTQPWIQAAQMQPQQWQQPAPVPQAEPQIPAPPPTDLAHAIHRLCDILEAMNAKEGAR